MHLTEGLCLSGRASALYAGGSRVQSLASPVCKVMENVSTEVPEELLPIRVDNTDFDKLSIRLLHEFTKIVITTVREYIVLLPMHTSKRS